MRGSLAFAAILVAVGLSAVGNVFASSVATMFPAVFLSTMVGLWLSHEVHNHYLQTHPFSFSSNHFTISSNAFSLISATTYQTVQVAVPCGAVGPIMFGSLSVPWLDLLFRNRL